ncbi:MAG: hypothetical protein NTV47_02335 [Actinobacteria bacterium]|nr:hypothetical protein [Actinomycetota bacterium]
MTNPIFLTAKRGPAITFALLSTLILIILPIVSGVYLAVGKSNPAPKIAHFLLAKSEFRDAAANKLIESISKDTKGAEALLFKAKGKEIRVALSDAMGTKAFEDEVVGITHKAYNFYVDGDSQSATIDIRPIASMALTAISKVNPLFSLAKDQIKDIAPIDLKSGDSDINLVQIKKEFTGLVFVLWIGFILFSALYWRFASNLHNGLKFAGIQSAVFAVISILIYLIGSAAGSSIASKTTDALPQIAIPIVAKAVISPFLTLGVLGFVASGAIVGYLFLKIRGELASKG